MSERILDEESLRERLRLQGQVVEHMHTALWVWAREEDGTLRLEYANAASGQATGVRPEEVVGKTLSEALPNHGPELVGILTQVLETGSHVDLGELPYGDERIPTSVFAMRVFPLPNDRIGVAFENVTERSRSQRALEESESRFRGAFESSSIGMSLADLDGRFVQVNDRLAGLLGYSPTDLADLHTLDVLHPDERARARVVTADLVKRDSGPFTEEFRAIRRDGSELWTRIGVSLVRDYAGRPVHVLMQVEDMSERRDLEQQLRQAQKLEALGRLAGGVAHDFNNLLTAISGYTQFLIDGLEDERLRRHAQEIQRASSRAASLTGQLLAFSRRQVLQPRVLDLNAIVSDMDMMLRRLIAANVELTTRLDAAVGAVRADPTQIEQVIINVAVNARDAMPQGGSLTIETFETSLADRPAIALVITDTGIGMTDDQRQRLFDPFFTTKEGGTGLGLATVYGIVEQSGGTIEVESAPGLGSSFRIILPRVDEALDPVSPSPGAVEPPPGGTETILLVEDESIVRQLVAEIIEAGGYTVISAGDGPSALELLRRHQGAVDLLLTDVVMPGMSGREVAHAVTAMRPGMRVLFMSGYTDAAIDHHGAFEPGVAYLQKPFTADELTRSLRQLLDV